MTERTLRTFRIYPERSEGRKGYLFATVRVWPTRRAFRKHGKKIDNRTMLHPRCDGCCTTISVWKVSGNVRRMTPEFAWIDLMYAHTDMNTVVHELQHAAFAWAVRRRLDPREPVKARIRPGPRVGDRASVEERIAEAIGNMASDFVQAGLRTGIYRDTVKPG